MDEKDFIMLNYLSKEKNISTVAKQLYTSQPALSYRLKRIEEELGIKIFVKLGRNLEFTPEGEYLIAYTQDILKRINFFRDDLHNMSSKPRGDLRLAVTSITARYYLPQILKNYTRKYPDVKIKVKVETSPGVLNLIENQEVHAGILRGDYNWDGEKNLIGSEGICLVSNSPIDLEELPNLPLIYRKKFQGNSSANTEDEHSFSNQIESWWYERYLVPPQYNIEVGGFDACKEMVKNNLGYSFIPELFITKDDDLYIQALQFKEGKTISRNTWLFYREPYMQMKFFKYFIEECKSHM